MAIDFPSSPSVNDSFTSGGKTWVWNGTYWKLYGSVLRGLSLEISDTPPASPVSGDMWYESDTGRTFTYYDGAWVELGNTAAVTAFLTDADGDTIVHVEEGTDDDTIRFDTAGSERMTIDASGDIIINESLTVSGAITVGETIGGTLKSPYEQWSVSATAATGTVNVDVVTAGAHYFTADATADWTYNFRGDGSTSLDSLLAVNESVTIVHAVTNGVTAYYPTAFQVDGSAVTPKWSGGSAPTSGNASSVDAYLFTVVKTASAAFTVLAQQVQFA
jgi:hypothetical protein